MVLSQCVTIVVYIVSNGARVLLLSGGQVGRISFCVIVLKRVCLCVRRSLINSAQTQNGPLEGENGEFSNNIFTEEIDGWSIARASLDTWGKISLILSLRQPLITLFAIPRIQTWDQRKF